MYSSLSGIPSTFAPSAHSHAAGDIDSGTLADARIPNLNTSKLTAGTLGVARGGTGATTFASGSFLQGNGTGAIQTRTVGQVLSDIGAAAASHTHAASDIASGTLAVNRGGTGAATLTSGSFLRGNGTSAVQLRTPAQVKADIDAMDKHFTVNAQTGASYTLSLADDGALVTRSNASPNTLTVPANASVAFPVGTVINFAQTGEGVTTIVGASGVTINGVSVGSAAVNKRYAAGSLVKIATNEWLLSGPVADVE